ncbi:hypothetical protein [Pseudodesulfovibrio portus]|uniref:Uncharacterized protein n=1 Tax=Pseudodesulfovibrio portus TaxID=231439 RepID=A0ABN6RQY6_9BACT|nr:hypothetical protein [Pseudodesulfovibrio portus]BDQ33330.1 hypothetical protein JCM14722_08720 [Pseudodesulfovibrio portus]
MSTQRIEHTVQEYTYKRPKRAREDVEFPLAPETSKSRQEDGTDSRDATRGRILALLRQVEGEGQGSLSFADVIAHHEAVQSRWNSEVGEDLAELGVNVDAVFRLMYDPAGVVTVAGGHSDQEMIDSYFIANPGKVRELGEILQYGRLASAAGTGLNRNELEQPRSAEAMTEWYASNVNPASLSGGGGMLFGAGGTVYRGLDIRV